MRMSTLQVFNRGVNAMVEKSTESSNTQQQISSGRKILSPADDPLAATRILQISDALALSEQYQKNIIAVENRQQLEEVMLQSVVNDIQRVRELTLTSNDGSFTLQDRQAVGAEIKERLQSIVDGLNAKDAGNEYIFGGFKGDTLPFQAREGGGYSYFGDEGQRFLPISISTEVATGDSGKAVFMDVPSAQFTFDSYPNPNNVTFGETNITQGQVVDQEAWDAFYPDDLIVVFNAEDAVSPAGPNFSVLRRDDNRVVDNQSKVNYVPGAPIAAAGAQFAVFGEPKPGDEFIVESTDKQSILKTIGYMIDGLDRLTDSPEDSATLQQLVSDTIISIDSSLTIISETRSKVGGRLNTIESIDSLHQDLDLSNKEVLSELQDVDYAEAVSQLSFETFVLEAAQASFARINNLSLFNSLR